MSKSDPAIRFENISALVRNLRNVLPPLTEAQSQLVGLYILNAVYLGEGEDFSTFPTLDREKPKLRIISGCEGVETDA